MTVVIGLSVVSLMAFGLALSYYKNIIFDRQLELMRKRNIRLQEEISGGYAELKYLSSTQFKDKYAKENLSLLRSGEKVLLLKQESSDPAPPARQDLTDEEKEALLEENLRSIRIIDHWKIYLFSRDSIDTLRTLHF